MLKIFLTGATGFIGRHFLDLAHASGHETIAITRNLDSIPDSYYHKATWIPASLSSVMAKHFKDCNILVHLASSGVSPQAATWEDLVKDNVLATANLIKAAHIAGINRIVAVGSAHEYGRSSLEYDALPVNAALHPISLYAASKAAAFEILYGYASANSLSLYYGRIFQAYGEGQHETNFWPSLYKAAMSGNDFEMTEGTQLLDFIPVQNVAMCLLDACQRSYVPGVPTIENIASGNPIQLRDFAQNEWRRLNAKGSLKIGKVIRAGNVAFNYIPEL